MAIEIIPKPESKLEKKGNIFFIISLIVLISIVTCYFYFFWIFQKKSEELNQREEQLSQLKSGDEFSRLQSDLSEIKKKIDSFENLFKNHNSILGFFKFLEKNTHIKIAWKKVSLSKESLKDQEGDAYKASISGKADNFITLAQQMIVLKNRSEILSATLKGLSLEEKNNVSFGVEVIFNPNLFIFK